jgi:CHU_C Type IX secretion signal domain/PKD domain
MKRMYSKLFCLLLIISCYTAFSEPGPYFRFIENKSQWPGSIDFVTLVPGGNMAIYPGRFSYTLLDFNKLDQLHERGHEYKGFQEVAFASCPEEMIDGYVVNVDFIGSNKESKAKPFSKLSTYYNFFNGNDSKKWASDVHAFEGLLYPSFYDGIDLKVYAQSKNLKYDFIVSPGADPSQILVAYEGAKQLYLNRGDLIAQTPFGDLIEKKPVAYQVIEGKRVLVKCDFKLIDDKMSFFFPEGYNSCYELVIDPILIFSTYSGSTADNWGSTATPGERGKLYSAGSVNLVSSGGLFPVTTGSFQTSYGGIYDIGILKYDSLGEQLLYASYLGGSDNESVHSLIMNSNQELVVLGTTSSLNFPMSNPYDASFNGGTVEQNIYQYTNGSDIFVARISGDGRQLLASTYLGGSANDGLNPNGRALNVNYGDGLRGDIITDGNGNIYISTVTSSTDFPVMNSFNTAYNTGFTDALILKLDASLAIQWGAFIGGNGEDAAHTLKLDKSGDLYVAGGTSSNNFPVTIEGYEKTFGGIADGWIAKIANDGTALLSATYTGTPLFDQVYFVDLNKDDEVYVYGQTTGTFPVTSGTYSNSNGKQFLQKFNKDLKRVVFSTVFGSGRSVPDISPTAFLINDCNNIFMTGWGGLTNRSRWGNTTSTIGLRVTNDAYQTTTSGSDFYFIVLTADASELLYATYMGGRNSATHVDGGTSRFDKNGVVYHAVCSGCRPNNTTGHSTSDFPTTISAWSRTNNSSNCNNAAFKFDLSSLKARIQTNAVNLMMPGLDRVCLPDKIVFQNKSIGGKMFEWDFGDNTATSVNNNQDITHAYKAEGRYIVKLKAIDIGTCVGEDLTSTVVNVYTPLGKAGQGGLFCEGSSFLLKATGGVQYEWVELKGNFRSNSPSPAVSPATEGDYEVLITDFQGCSIKDTINVKAIPRTDFKFSWKRTFDCQSRPILEVKNQTDETEETFWDFGDGTISDQKDEKHYFEKDGLYSVRLVGKKDFCVYDERITVPAFTIFVPNVITPDQSPGMNDTFQVLYGGSKPEDRDMVVSLIVYNRWGVKVYESQDYRSNWAGNGLANGVYYYEVTFKGETTCKNWVQIIR